MLMQVSANAYRNAKHLSMSHGRLPVGPMRHSQNAEGRDRPPEGVVPRHTSRSCRIICSDASPNRTRRTQFCRSYSASLCR
uniref:Uncharacterized protein n=1 Tax=Knipowitschia caucasica TaxID=637954 RepID=A0AAV2LDA2_KNICA